MIIGAAAVVIDWKLKATNREFDTWGGRVHI